MRKNKNYVLCWRSCKKRQNKLHTIGYYNTIEQIMSYNRHRKDVLLIYRIGNMTDPVAISTPTGSWDFYTDYYNIERISGKYA